jgi:hypothetical protein
MAEAEEVMSLVLAELASAKAIREFTSKGGKKRAELKAEYDWELWGQTAFNTAIRMLRKDQNIKNVRLEEEVWNALRPEKGCTWPCARDTIRKAVSKWKKNFRAGLYQPKEEKDV